MLKNVYFMEKYCKNRLSSGGWGGSQTPASLLLSTITTLSSLFLALNAFL